MVVSTRIQNNKRIKRALIPVSAGHVHVRYAGSGPPLIMLHECPRSSLSLLPLIALLSDQFCCIAMDIPGYGESDALPMPREKTTIIDFSTILGQVIDTLGVDKVHLYGTHTGAAIAVQYAIDSPQRVARLFLDGPPAFTHDEQASMLKHYLPAIDVSRDGAHLTRVWTRVLDQQTYFPFYRRSSQYRLDTLKTDLATADRTAIGFLTAGENYSTAYRVALSYDTVSALAQLDNVDVVISCLRSDMLALHIPRLQLPAKLLDTVADTAALIAQQIKPGAVVLDHQVAAVQSTDKYYVSLEHSCVHIECDDTAIVDLPGFGRSYSHSGLTMGNDVRYRDIALNFLTHYFSELGLQCSPDNVVIREFDRVVLPVLNSINSSAGTDTDSFHEQMHTIIPDLQNDWSGSHLIRAWVWARTAVESDNTSDHLSDSARLRAINDLFLFLIQSKGFITLLRNGQSNMC